MDRFKIQLIAIVTMTIDHIAMILLDNTTFIYALLRIIGRIAFPLFCFLLAEGARHTHSILKYLLRIFLMALAIEIGYTIGKICFHTEVSTNLNIFFTLFVGLGMLALLRLKSPYLKALAILPLTIVILIKVFALKIPIGDTFIPLTLEYDLYGLALILLFGLSKKVNTRIIGMLAISFFFCYPGFAYFFKWEFFMLNSFGQHAALLAIPFIITYNGEKGFVLPKYFTYLYYPLHLLLLFLISYLLE